MLIEIKNCIINDEIIQEARKELEKQEIVGCITICLTNCNIYTEVNNTTFQKTTIVINHAPIHQIPPMQSTAQSEIDVAAQQQIANPIAQ